MNTTKEIQTYSPISGLHVCANGTGHYVEKADYEKVQELRDKWTSCANDLADALRKCTWENVAGHRFSYEEKVIRLHYVEQALKTFEELRG